MDVHCKDRRPIFRALAREKGDAGKPVDGYAAKVASSAAQDWFEMLLSIKVGRVPNTGAGTVWVEVKSCETILCESSGQII